MATNRLEAVKGDVEPESAASEGSSPPVAARGGFKAWLPLITNVTLMPVLAYVMTVFVLPRMHSSSNRPLTSAVESSEKVAASLEEANGKNRFTAPLTGKILVNVAGTMGTRYLLANVTLVSATTDLKIPVDKNDAQLRDVAASVLANKTINDLEKPGARNLIRTELISAFNTVLGNGVVSEIYITEFAIRSDNS